ncbi:MAG: response regulator transcription factor [Actinomycetia bacterium]|nr:response regulator transcription factor [Actinomycetes bacterium]
MRVLVVEDELAMADSIRRGLEAEGMAVDVAHDGETGLWMARENSYDAILLDIMLPKINGYVVCKTLRDEENWTPVLMLTAKQGEFDEAEGLDTGADDYVTKPFSFVVLLARLRALVRRKVAERPTVLTIGDLVLDPASREVARGDVPIDVTAREFSILEHLMRRPGEVVSKTAILDAVWDLNFDGDTNIVEVYVSSLRKKIDAPFGRKSIQTVRGAGYRLNPGPG